MYVYLPSVTWRREAGAGPSGAANPDAVCGGGLFITEKQVAESGDNSDGSRDLFVCFLLVSL